MGGEGGGEIQPRLSCIHYLVTYATPNKSSHDPVGEPLVVVVLPLAVVVVALAYEVQTKSHRLALVQMGHETVTDRGQDRVGQGRAGQGIAERFYFLSRSRCLVKSLYIPGIYFLLGGGGGGRGGAGGWAFWSEFRPIML